MEIDKTESSSSFNKVVVWVSPSERRFDWTGAQFFPGQRNRRRIGEKSRRYQIFCQETGIKDCIDIWIKTYPHESQDERFFYCIATRDAVRPGKFLRRLERIFHFHSDIEAELRY